MKETPGAKSAEKTIPLNEVVISLYEAQDKVYPRSVSGFFTKWRWVMIWLTQLFFYGVPWLDWGSRQALLFNLETKRFYIFNLVLYPQDLIYLTAILIISALSLFLFTAIAGRLWCGYACPQTVYTEIFLWIERKIEGDRAARMRLDAADMSSKKFSRKAAKHFVWIAFALWTGFTFVGYFTPIRELSQSVLSLNLGPWETFWICFYGFATYGNAGFMREQVCKYMCPYARFQSAMFDDDTLIVTYDEARGEPRGGRSRKVEVNSKELGSCIDCNLCVQVCPTGIDIRKGLQYECIGCGACADVCDTVMDKMGYERGLVKYSTQNAVDNKWTHKQMLQRILRPRVLIYSAVLILLIVSLLASLWLRTPFRVNVVRDGVIARMTDDGMIENVYRLQIMNGTESTQHFKLNVSGLKDLEIETKVAKNKKPAKDSKDMNRALKSEDSKNIEDEENENKAILVKPAESRWIIVDLKIPDGTEKSGSHKIKFEIQALESKETITEKSVFLVPRQ
ncbi:cytochrome c oxidase accessory protein CcoG [Methylotenera sp.]|uniref:cytochrome c oxidase accessory protein CcoG n=1 Tax=Methylotenera sp. TaxID=2051956 RepID=UPI002717A3B1|nr:cytochrome c oxidase accessory protein CcoG [Methylotenera sp.]MDO9205510.1 cytochrome c oxidase accessory protein CcoG [Methylotenera sp.]MDP2231118.1 cytochrome c oxidase accessory protein CcoG [Methylotenera sp.]MDP3140250.1 cytochrome c oxidase accessory protein CcoG [Methylotenera sp.]MDP3307791.1 cytochrome c oxidase accessory protein CcoG [Methylotenera sp.]MDP3818553.1 cytochrome c oxidase accessory protein CcoG [Methylotenera sp.]